MSIVRLVTILVIFFIGSLRADNVTLTKNQASELFVALSTIEPGLTPSNTVAAADAINALRPHVEALDKGKAAFNKFMREVNRTQPKDGQEQLEKLAEAFDTKANETITVDLPMIKLADEEISAAKIKPAALAVIRRWMKK